MLLTEENKMIYRTSLLILLLTFQPTFSQTLGYLKALGAPNKPKVEVSWNRYNSNAEIGEIIQKLAKAYPNLAKSYSIGKSVSGRDIWVIEVTNKKQGTPDRKPGMYIDGNIHGNEIQGSEVVLYTAWYLLENYATVSAIKEMVDRTVFYLIPSINPDGRDAFIIDRYAQRGGFVPLDSDGDGLADEDGPEDLDNDGFITSMRKKSTRGRYKLDPEDPRIMVRVKPDEQGQYEWLGREGIDNDGDGRVNEDGPGGYDPNRNWAYAWQPDYVQYGSGYYPFSLPETRTVAEFVLSHPNIAAFQSYHNSGGMILRGPGEKSDEYDSRDIRGIYDVIGKKGEEILPGYRYLLVYKDLYQVYGGELDWFYLGRGIVGFSNELWTSFNYFRREEKSDAPDQRTRRQKDVMKFNDLLLFKEAFVEWKPYKHPTYGDIEIGGMKHLMGRNPPSFLLEEECHRNMAFTLYHASHLEEIEFRDVEVKDLGGDIKRIRVTVVNKRLMPTRCNWDVRKKITRPDWLMLKGKDVNVLAAGIVEDPYIPIIQTVKAHPERIEIPTLWGNQTETVQFIVQGQGEYVLTYDSVKGGIVTKTERL
jgi:murein tripeptide amidase MpaA